MLLILTLVCATIVASQIELKDNSYNGYKVVRLIPQTIPQLKLMQKLEQEFTDLDFWSTSNALNQTCDVMVPPHIAEQLKEILQSLKIPGITLIDDVQQIINEEKLANDVPTHFSPFSRSLPWNKYHRLTDIHQYLTELASANPHIANIIDIGKSFEGRELKLIKIGTQNYRSKPAIWIDAGIHAREWIAPATALYIIDQLVNNYSTNKALVDQLDWYILPVVNPDGYEYTHTNTRLWRKTRSTRSNSACVGVDGNRNFEFYWNHGGSSSNPCSNVYHGPYAFSEPETAAIAKFILGKKNQFKFFLTIHSYSQVLLLPWGHTTKLPEDFEEMESIGKKAMNILRSVYGTSYEVGNSNQIMYPTSGSSPDWAKGIAGIKYSYCLELRDKGKYGFMLPPSQILATGQETFEAIKSFGNFVADL